MVAIPTARYFGSPRCSKPARDPRFIARRLVNLRLGRTLASPTPRALVVATAAYEAVERVGLPEAGLILAPRHRLLGNGSEIGERRQGRVASASRHRGPAPAWKCPSHPPQRLVSGGRAGSSATAKATSTATDFSSDDPRRYRQHYLPAGVSGPFYQPGPRTVPKPPSASASPRSQALAPLPPHRSRYMPSRRGAMNRAQATIHSPSLSLRDGEGAGG